MSSAIVALHAHECITINHNITHAVQHLISVLPSTHMLLPWASTSSCWSCHPKCWQVTRVVITASAVPPSSTSHFFTLKLKCGSTAGVAAQSTIIHP